MSEYTKIFQIFSQQPNNTIHREMIPNLLRQAGYTIKDTEARNLISRFKEDEVTIEQFIELAEDLKMTEVNMQKIKAAFKLYDYDDVGFIDVRAVKVILQDDFDELMVEEIVRAMNPDGDGRIYYEGVLKMLEK